MSKEGKLISLDCWNAVSNSNNDSKNTLLRRYQALNSTHDVLQFAPITQDDVEEVAAFELKAKSLLPPESKEFFFNHDSAWFSQRLEEGAHIVGVRDLAHGGAFVAKSNIYVRDNVKDIFGEGVPEKIIEGYSLDKAAFLGGAVVLPNYGSLNIHKKMMDLRLIAFQSMPVDHAFSVTNIENYPSGSNLLGAGFKIRGYMEDPRDQARIYCYHIRNGSSLVNTFRNACDIKLEDKYRISGGKAAVKAFITSQYKAVDFDDATKAERYLQEGYVGVGRIAYDLDKSRGGQIIFAHPDDIPEIT